MSVPPETYLDEFPSDWQLMELGSIANVKGGKRLPKGAEYADTITDHAYLRVTDFENLSVNLADLKYISEDVHEHVARYTISSDDVYISIAGTIGLVGTIPDELNGANLTENAAKIVVLDQDVLHARFLAYWLSSPQGQAETRLRTTKTSQPKLALMRIRQIPIPLPPLAEQRRIAGVLNTIQDAIAAQEDVIAAARELKRSLMQRLFTYGPYREPAETKETEIGEIPVHWEMVEFGSQVDLLSGYAFKSEHYTDDYNAPRLLRGDNIAQGRLRWDNEKRWPLDG
ncbi:MAG: restriction endonuclease subunit S, partial [Caldilineaceae bacterium]|nr:restriction endonuclease subunit S [Caldilineaceae bacterium]